MGRSKELTKDEKIKKEIIRLNAIYTDIDSKKKKLIEGLIQQSAYMKVMLEQYQKDLDEKGYVELFSQSPNTPPYERERPVAHLYNSLNKNYQTIMKQLADFIDKAPHRTDDNKGDGFDEFVGDRHD